MQLAFADRQGGGKTDDYASVKLNRIMAQEVSLLEPSHSVHDRAIAPPCSKSFISSTSLQDQRSRSRTALIKQQDTGRMEEKGCAGA